ncbi:MAG TPA: hypothetical protein VF082_05855, partial [Jiangellaceae bacterium]
MAEHNERCQDQPGDQRRDQPEDAAAWRAPARFRRCGWRWAGIWQVDDGSVFLVTSLERDLSHRRKRAWSLERDEVLVAQRGGHVSEGLHDVIGIRPHDAAACLVNDGWPEGVRAGLYDVEDRFGVQDGLAQLH